MNKLDVAIKLLRLLNERKELDSKAVAQELNVSLRTAQRYLMELSAMPCVANGRTNHSYRLNSGYELNKALINEPARDCDDDTEKEPDPSSVKTVCLFCGAGVNSCNAACWSLDSRPVSNKYRIDRLYAIIKRRLVGNKCSIP